jgi:hypothetical protein
MNDVDLIILTRDAALLRPPVQAGIDAQRGVRLTVHRVVGAARPNDAHRWETIARARNEGKTRGRAPWVMYLDDDVVLAPDTVARLVAGLKVNRRYAALAADYLGEASEAANTAHVAMGATLFRRVALAGITFRWSADRCECQCCCDDLRRQGWGIRYWPGARSSHLDPLAGPAHTRDQNAVPTPPAEELPGRILVAFDRRHYDKFRRQFLGSLRGAGNPEAVTVVAYGLYPSEQARLAALPSVTVVPRPRARALPPVRRLRDFQEVLAGWPRDTPVAYWDAGDVLFQGPLTPLWGIVRTHPGRLLAVREPTGYPANSAVAAWTLSISDAAARRQALDLLAHSPFLNSGFSAGTAGTLLAYLRSADHLLHSPALQGTTDWGDQMALNLYCHLNPHAWLEVEEGWNYCIHDRAPREIRVTPEGRVVSARGTPIHVVHGNAHSLRYFELSGFGLVRA